MNPTTKKGLIIFGSIATIGTAIWLYFLIRNKRHPEWKGAHKLSLESKLGKTITIKRN